KTAAELETAAEPGTAAEPKAAAEPKKVSEPETAAEAIAVAEPAKKSETPELPPAPPVLAAEPEAAPPQEVEAPVEADESAPEESASTPPPEPRESAPEPEVEAPKPAFSAKVTPIDALTLERASTAEAHRLAEELARAAALASPEETVAPPRQTTPEAVDLRRLFDREETESPRTTHSETPTPEPRQAPETAESAEDEKPESAVQVAPPPPPPASEPESSRLALPSGIVGHDTFQKLLESKQTFHGTVVAIGVSGLETVPWEENGTAELVKGLLKAEDLACRTSDTEFILTFPEQTGPAGQQRIQHVSQQLWDHQIRSVGRSPVMFCWGATEAKKDTLSAAVAGARDRLEQTRRNRERAPRQIHNYRVVNS
ncbi:MAG: hypothetical protein GY953_46460, partial [bacterium]|nr:hypothetical protein [bacterium]